MTPETVLILLLSLLDHQRVQTARTICARHRQTTIVQQVVVGSEIYGVPPALILSIGYMESIFGCAPGSGGSWGAPQSRYRRDIAGDPDGNANRAASALNLGYRQCRTWFGAISHFRCGRCDCPRLIGYQPRTAFRTAQRLDNSLR